jgi:hypothetical protein
MQRSNSIFFLLALIGGFILFKVKYEVVEIEKNLARTERQIALEKEMIHVLNAEWTHLNEPQRLQKLAEKYLDIVPMDTKQIAAVINNIKTDKNFTTALPQSHLASMKGTE